jgi:transcriptional regulator with XRE-family HTH domain
MRAVSSVLGRSAAYVSEVEKGIHAVKEPMIPLWARALNLPVAQVRGHWIMAQRLPEPPVVRRPALKAEARMLQDKIALLTKEEQTKVYGYIDALLDQR